MRRSIIRRSWRGNTEKRAEDKENQENEEVKEEEDLVYYSPLEARRHALWCWKNWRKSVSIMAVRSFLEEMTLAASAVMVVVPRRERKANRRADTFILKGCWRFI